MWTAASTRPRRGRSSTPSSCLPTSKPCRSALDPAAAMPSRANKEVRRGVRDGRACCIRHSNRRPARADASLDGGSARRRAKDWFLLTMKKVIYAANIGEDDLGKDGGASCRWLQRCATSPRREGAEVLGDCAKVEEEISAAGRRRRRQMFLEDMGIGESGLDRLVPLGVSTAGLISYLTAGPKEVRAWTIKRAPRPRRPPARSIRTSSAASSARRSSPTTTWFGRAP